MADMNQTNASQEVNATQTNASQEVNATQTNASQEVDATQTNASQEVNAAQTNASQEAPKYDVSHLHEGANWQDLTEGLKVFGAGTSKQFITGEWTAIKPEFFSDRCKQCLLCVPCCPDSAIPVVNYKRQEFDLDHCKGCGICVKACPFGAIEMKGVKR